eukprot:6771401-Prymnesium_polylepis.1
MGTRARATSPPRPCAVPPRVQMLRKMAVVEKDLEVETKNREASEEQLVNALNDYTQALQDGLRIVNRAT